eukprot:g73562.t1
MQQPFSELTNSETQSQSQAVLLACEKYVSKTVLTQLDVEKLRGLLEKNDEVALSLHKVANQEKAFVAGVKALTESKDYESLPAGQSQTRLRRGLSGSLAINVPTEPNPLGSPVSGDAQGIRNKRFAKEKRKSVPDVSVFMHGKPPLVASSPNS